MEFYPLAMRYILPGDMDTFHMIRRVLDEMPNIVYSSQEPGLNDCKNQVSCHLICRALADNFGATVHDGYFATNYQHSWLVTSSGMSIIDAYPVAGATPFIVANDRYSPWSKLYERSDEFLKRKLKTQQFRKQLTITKKVVKETIIGLGLKPSPA